MTPLNRPCCIDIYAGDEIRGPFVRGRIIDLTPVGARALGFSGLARVTAHRTLPFGTLVKVCRPLPHNCIVVRINDRGPFVRGRVIDLTPVGAYALGFSGLARVKVEPIR